jgi:ATP-dependent Clp protease protease subunit
MTRPSQTTDQALQSEEEKDKDESGGFLLRRLLDSRTIMIAKPVDRTLMEKVAVALTILEAEDAKAPITVFVNSPGGDADSGFAIYDLLQFCRTPIRTICAGLAASAGIPIFLGGDKGQRYSLPHSRFLLHQPSMQMMGQASDLEITAAEILKIRTKYNEIVAAETGRKAKDVQKDADRDFWLNAEEAVKYGLVDRVIRHRGEVE